MFTYNITKWALIKQIILLYSGLKPNSICADDDKKVIICVASKFVNENWKDHSRERDDKTH